MLFIIVVVVLSYRFGVFYERLRIKTVFKKRYGVKITNEVFKEAKGDD
jgi:hypothetical protein